MWLCGPDGSDPRASYGNYPFPWHNFMDRSLPGGEQVDSRLETPVVEMGVRAIPGSTKFVATGRLITARPTDPWSSSTSMCRMITGCRR